jgi:hypothetical protein
MHPKLKAFFNIASAKAEATIAQQAADQDAEARKKAKLEADTKLLRDTVREEIGPILKALKSLPDRDGKAFKMVAIEQVHEDMPYVGISISYAEPTADFTNSKGGGDWNPKEHPEVALGVTINRKGKPEFRCVQYSVIESTRETGFSPAFKTTKPKNFDAARAELAFAFGNFAADRVPEIGAALEKGSNTSAAPQSEPRPRAVTLERRPKS